MNNGRNHSERAAISLLRQIMNPKLGASEYRISGQCNLFVQHVVDAAITEIRRESLEQLEVVREELDAGFAEGVISQDEKARAAELVAKQYKQMGIDLPEGPTYEERG